MEDYKMYPPCKSLLRVLKTCPRSAVLYIQLWVERNKNSQKKSSLLIDKSSIRKKFLLSPTVFRNLVLPLVGMNLVDLELDEEDDDKYEIRVVG